MISFSRSIVLLSCASSVASFAPTTPLNRHNGHVIVPTPAATAAQGTALSMAGFGGGSGSKKGKKKSKGAAGGATLPKLKAKAQWDRYAEMKTSDKITVGVRDKDNGEWFKVGRVRSANNEYTEVAVARQRALIAEHSKRLYPVQIPSNAVLEWGYETNDDEWVAVDKNKGGDDVAKGIEKQIGFEGISDKATGFYCFYHEGRVVERDEAGGKGVAAPGAGSRDVKSVYG